MIKEIPISSRLPANKLRWVEASNGKFSVRSAYGIAIRLSKFVDRGAGSNNSQLHLFWKKIWELPLPHKVHHSTWGACRDILPIKVNLMQWKVVQDEICDECRLDAETTGRLFWTCTKAREV